MIFVFFIKYKKMNQFFILISELFLTTFVALGIIFAFVIAFSMIFILDRPQYYVDVRDKKYDMPSYEEL